ncbi:MAG: caspase family protein [Acidobacteriota bacterium]
MKKTERFRTKELHRTFGNKFGLVILTVFVFVVVQTTPQAAALFVEIGHARPAVVAIQPKIGKLQISKPNVDGTVDVTIEIENVRQELTRNDKKEMLSSGVYDLRLFRDGQLIGSSTPKEAIEKYIAAAPRLVEEGRNQKELINTPEDKAWREANDLAKVVKFDAGGKALYTFKNIKLPKNGRSEVEFSAYAFNSDRVKSDTARQTYKIEKPEIRKGKTYLMTIGVNASENPAWNLNYAANDADKMQEILGERLRASGHDLIPIRLVSNYGAGRKLTEISATKPIIRAAFSLLAGHPEEVKTPTRKMIDKIARIETVEPEDTLIITFSGHGYADQNGIFYLLPYDVGSQTYRLTSDSLPRLISSDELSLWMRDVTAAEMIMIVDACHSSAAVQGDNFKPGPMGSRGLGQLAYDKDMKILSATQANNVALELGSLKQGLLSYALLQDGIVRSLADTDKNKQLLSTEWLSFAEKRVPELYQEVIEGKREVIINGSSTKGAKAAENFVGSSTKQTSALYLQQPSLFDFKRRKTSAVLFRLNGE